MLSHFSHVWLFATRWTIACQVPLSMGILQARILERVANLFSRGSSWPWDWTCHLLCLLHWQVGSLPLAATWEAQFFDTLTHPDTKTRQRHHKKIIINTFYEYKCKNLQQNTRKSNTIVYKKRIAHNDPVRLILAIQVWWNMTTKVIHNVKN